MDPTKWWNVLKDVFQKTAKVWILVFMVSVFFVFSPVPVVQKLSLESFEVRYASFVGFSFVFSSVVLLIMVVDGILSWAKKIRRMHQFKKQLHFFTPEQKQILCQYLVQETSTQYFSIEDGVVNALVGMHVLYRGSAVGRLDEWAFNISPWAQKYLNENLELITRDVPRDPDGQIVFYQRQSSDDDPFGNW